jgi:hypothetical protein
MGPGERRLLAAMPLHAITAVHGEKGLRERLAIETATFPTADRKRIAQALDLASRVHAGDRRQNEPYVNHLLRVAIRIISHYRVSDADVVCAALLHDAVEDHAGDLSPSGGRTEAAARYRHGHHQRADVLASCLQNLAQCACHGDQDGVVSGPAVPVRGRPQRCQINSDRRDLPVRSGPLVQ